MNINKNDDFKYKLEELVSFKSNDDGSFEIAQVDFTKDFKEYKGENFIYKLN